MDIQKLNIPTAIVLAAVITGVAFYAVQLSKQKSIERQQELQLEQDRKEAETKAEQERQVSQAKSELEKKQYSADRKEDCLNIYKTEDDKWNNVRGWRYDEIYDSCYIRFKDPKPKTEIQCDKDFPTDDGGTYWFRMNALCKDGEFENSF